MGVVELFEICFGFFRCCLVDGNFGCFIGYWEDQEFYCMMMAVDYDDMDFVDWSVGFDCFGCLFFYVGIQIGLVLQDIIEYIVVDSFDVNWIGLFDVFGCIDVLGWEWCMIQYVQKGDWVFGYNVVCFFDMVMGVGFFEVLDCGI